MTDVMKNMESMESHQKTEITKTDVLTQKILFIKNIITVEPLIALYQMAQFLSRPALHNLEFEKTCRVNLNYNDSVCETILSGNHKNFSLQNERIQVLVSNMHSWQQPIQSFTPLILILFLGSFSDRHKWRKPFLIFPVFGELFGVLGCILCVIFMKLLPLEVQGVSQKVIPSLFGGQTMLVMASTAYIADISSVKMRTLRLGIVHIVLSVCSPFAYSISGILFKETGYIGVLGISAGLNAVALLYSLLWIKEPRSREKYDKKCILSDVFNPTHAINTFQLILKEKPGNNRCHIVIVLIMIFLYRCAFDGESSVFYLYTQNVFQWTPLEYSCFITVNGLVLLFGNALGLPLFTRYFHLSDLTILFVTILDKIITNIIFGVANTVSIFYVGVFASIITNIYKVVKKSIATKIVSEDDIGKAQSLLGICEALAPAVSVPLFNKLIYVNTLTTYPAAFFFFSILFYGTCCILIMWMYYQENKKVIYEVEENAVNKNTENFIETIHM